MFVHKIDRYTALQRTRFACEFSSDRFSCELWSHAFVCLDTWDERRRETWFTSKEFQPVWEFMVAFVLLSLRCESIRFAIRRARERNQLCERGVWEKSSAPAADRIEIESGEIRKYKVVRMRSQSPFHLLVNRSRWKVVFASLPPARNCNRIARIPLCIGAIRALSPLSLWLAFDRNVHLALGQQASEQQIIEVYCWKTNSFARKWHEQHISKS